MRDGSPGPKWGIFCALALAASLSLSACFSKGVVQDPQTPAEQALVGIGEARGALLLVYDDVVGLYQSGALTQAQANSKEEVKEYNALLGWAQARGLRKTSKAS